MFFCQCAAKGAEYVRETPELHEARLICEVRAHEQERWQSSISPQKIIQGFQKGKMSNNHLLPEIYKFVIKTLSKISNKFKLNN